MVRGVEEYAFAAPAQLNGVEVSVLQTFSDAEHGNMGVFVPKGGDSFRKFLIIEYV